MGAVVTQTTTPAFYSTKIEFLESPVGNPQVLGKHWFVHHFYSLMWYELNNQQCKLFIMASLTNNICLKIIWIVFFIRWHSWEWNHEVYRSCSISFLSCSFIFSSEHPQYHQCTWRVVLYRVEVQSMSRCKVFIDGIHDVTLMILQNWSPSKNVLPQASVNFLYL